MKKLLLLISFLIGFISIQPYNNIKAKEIKKYEKLYLTTEDYQATTCYNYNTLYMRSIFSPTSLRDFDGINYVSNTSEFISKNIPFIHLSKVLFKNEEAKNYPVKRIVFTAGNPIVSAEALKDNSLNKIIGKDLFYNIALIDDDVEVIGFNRLLDDGMPAYPDIISSKVSTENLDNDYKKIIINTDKDLRNYDYIGLRWKYGDKARKKVESLGNLKSGPILVIDNIDFYSEKTVDEDLTELKLKWNNTESFFNGKFQRPDITIENIKENEDIKLEIEGGGIEAGEYTVSIKNILGKDANRYRLPSNNSVKFKILPSNINGSANLYYLDNNLNNRLDIGDEIKINQDNINPIQSNIEYQWTIIKDDNKSCIIGENKDSLLIVDDKTIGKVKCKLIFTGNIIGEIVTNELNIANIEGLKKSMSQLTKEKNGWIRENTIWRFYKKNKTLTNRWLKENNKWYYLNSKNGDMKTGWNKINDKWYYLDSENGDMKTGWNKINDKWYYLDSENGDMKTGWNKINDKWYYLDSENGNMKTVWNKISVY